MASAIERHRNNTLVGSGTFFVDLEDEGGNLTGERYVGDSAGGTLTVTTERLTVFSGDGPVAKQLVNKVRSKSYALSIVLRDMSLENYALALGAAAPADAAAVAAEAVADEEHTVIQDRWYQLGRSDANPRGVRAVSEKGIAVTSSDGNTTYDADDDYVVDADRGRLFIVADGAIAAAAAETIKIDYTPVAAEAGASQRVSVKEIGDIRGAVRYLEESDQGEGRDIYARLCSISGTGETPLKSRDAEQQITVACEVLDPPGTAPQLVIDGEPA